MASKKASKSKSKKPKKTKISNRKKVIEAGNSIIKLQTFSVETNKLLTKASKGLKPRDQDGPDVRGDVLSDKKIIRPLFDPSQLAQISTRSSRLAKSIDIVAKNVVGLGWDIFENLTEDERRNITESQKVEIKKQSSDLTNFLDNSNPDMPFDVLMDLIKVNEETTGNGYLEIVRDNNNDITEFHHLPSRTMRIRKDEPGFVQLRGGKARFFIEFGSDLRIDPESGKVVTGTVLREKLGNEVIHFRVEHPADDFYGIPRWISAIPSVIGNRLSDERNINFMENDATPRLAIVINGGELDSASIESIQKFIQIQGQGVENAERVMVLQADRKMKGPQSGDAPKIEFHPLTIGINEDAAFLKYRQANNDEIKEVFGISDLFYGMSRDINRAAASVAKQVTNEQEFAPERRRIEHIFNKKIFPKLPFATNLVKLEFKSPVINDLSTLADGFSKAAAAGGITPNDIRKMIGIPLYPATAEYDWADFPIVIALKFMELSAFNLLDDVDDEPAREDDKKRQEEEGEETEQEEEEEEKEEESENKKAKMIGTFFSEMKRNRKAILKLFKEQSMK